MGATASTINADTLQENNKAVEVVDTKNDEIFLENDVQNDSINNKSIGIPSNNKLKKIAFGQGYKDIHREYDGVLQTIDFNKTSQLDWQTPANNFAAPKHTPNKSRRLEHVQDKKELKSNDTKESLHRRALNPHIIRNQSSSESPNSVLVHSKNASSESLSSPYNANNNLLNQRKIIASGDPYLMLKAKKLNNENSDSEKIEKQFGKKLSQNSCSNSINSNENSFISNKNNVESFASPLKSSLLNLNSSSNTSPTNSNGKKLISRPFSQHQSVFDDNDETYAEFYDNTQFTVQTKKPDIIPLLSISVASPAMMPQNQNMAHNIGGAQQHLFFGNEYGAQQAANFNIVQNNLPLKNNKNFQTSNSQQSNPPSTSLNNGNSMASNSIKSLPFTNNTNNNANNSTTSTIAFVHSLNTTTSSNNPPINIQTPFMANVKPRPQMPPPLNNLNIGVAPPSRSMPVVKETKDIKRNRAQIPDKLTHAKPTTGDWLKKRYIVNNYILLETLGTGSYAEVRLCKDRTTDKLFAIKIISKDFLKKKKNGKSSETYFEDIKREIAIMKKLLHPNVLKLFEVLDDPNVNKMYLVLEYMKMGDLVNILKSRNTDDTTSNTTANPTQALNEQQQPNNGNANNAKNSVGFTPLNDLEVWNIFKQVIAGIRYLHFQNVIHGDIKPQNLLLDEDGIVKIADFGISQMLHGSDQKLADAAGTPAFMSPELCEGKSFSGQLADIWAIGATMFMLRFGHPPFIAKNILNLYSKIVNDPVVYPWMIDPGLRNLLENILVKDPNERFTLEQVFKHPWLRCPPSTQLTQHISTTIKSHNNNQNNNYNNNNNEIEKKEELLALQILNTKMSSSIIDLTFKPPPTYDFEEAVASNAPKKTVDNDELFMSIGLRVKGSKQKFDKKENKFSEMNVKEENSDDFDDIEDDDDDDVSVVDFITEKEQQINIDEKKNTNLSKNDVSFVTNNSNMLKTNWGNDVFQMVEDEDESGDDDDDDDDDDNDDNDIKENKQSTKKKLIKSFSSSGNFSSSKNIVNINNSKNSQKSIVNQILNTPATATQKNKFIAMSNQPITTQEAHLLQNSSVSSFQQQGSNVGRNQMSIEEEKQRAFRFQKQVTAKKINDESFSTFQQEIKPFSNNEDLQQQSKSNNNQLNLKSSYIISNSSSSSVNVSNRYSIKNSPKKIKNLISGSRSLNKNDSQKSNVECFDETMDDLSPEEFEKMMDTLAMQPQQQLDDDDEHIVTSEVELLSLKIEGFSAQLRNLRNGLAAAFHSEQGVRHSQEDRCVLLPDMAQMKALENYEFEHIGVKEQLNNFSLACVFDGHNGWRSAQYLSQHLPGRLVTHERFLDKHVDAAIIETCATLDKELCRILRSEEDASGSTGSIAVYDGRKHVFTVASVGDSMCVLSRGGRAVMLNKMHRLDNVTERERVVKAGGVIFNNRINGLLAISRAFGDTLFKEVGQEGTEEGLVISVPEIYSEVITPMTEFAIIASDALWDVMKPQKAVQFVRTKLSKKKDLQETAKDLTNEAIAKGSIDNVTVLLITFHMKDNNNNNINNTAVDS